MNARQRRKERRRWERVRQACWSRDAVHLRYLGQDRRACSPDRAFPRWTQYAHHPSQVTCARCWELRGVEKRRRKKLAQGVARIRRVRAARMRRLARG